MEDKQVKCPICGQFTSAKSVEFYEGRISSLEKSLEGERKKCANQARWLHEKNETIQKYSDQYEDLVKIYDELLEEHMALKSRSLWRILADKMF